MTIDLLPDSAPDAEDFVCSWLQPVMRAATERKTNDPWPFAIVQLLTGEDCVDSGTEDDVVQVDYLDVARDGLTKGQAAKLSAREGHRRMMYLAKHCPDVELSDGSTANCDYLDAEVPARMDYPNELVVRYTARYTLGLSFVAADSES